MLYELVMRFKTILYPFLEDNIILYLLLVLIVNLVGGLDNSILTLIFLHILSCIVSLITSNPVIFSNKVKTYIVICVGVIIDSMIELSGDTKLRTYLIFYYTYNELVHIINMIVQDGNIKVPKQLTDIIDKIVKK